MDVNAPNTAMTADLLDLAEGLRWRDVTVDARHAARRHLVDTCGVIIAGSTGDVTVKTAHALGIPSGGKPLTDARKASPDAYAMLCGTAAHGIELDDGHRGGSVHPGVAVVPALMTAVNGKRLSGEDMLAALLVGYEVICSVAALGNPALRDRGFHPTSAVGPLGAALATGRVFGLSREGLSNALGIAVSSASGVFAFLSGGGDVKRLHGGMAARGGYMAACFAREGIGAPVGIMERPSGFLEAFMSKDASAPSLALPPAAPFNILDCYVKPYACCRHLQPAMEALMALREMHGLRPETVDRIEVETYRIAAKHASTGWNDLASAQLSFPYCLALALKLGRADLADFEEPTRGAPWIGEIAAKVEIREAADLTNAYPAERPARVFITCGSKRHEAYAGEATGVREKPLTDEGLEAKFLSLAGPLLGEGVAATAFERLWDIENAPDAGAVMELVTT
jgi:2-methylcitrate dehydratase PrpD